MIARVPLLIGLVLTLLVGTGCALSPQTVVIAPTPKVESRAVGGGRTLGLEVVDKRPQRQFGKRGGLYDTAYIEPAGDITGPLRRALAGVLTDYGFVVQPAGSPGVVNMRVEIVEISYNATVGAGMTHVATHADIGASLWSRDGREYSGHSKFDQNRDVALVPTAADNERAINDVISRALERMLNHPDLVAFMQK